MDLTLEAYRNIVRYVGHRTDIATLCRVSKRFQCVGERMLYNTLYLREPHETMSLSGVLARQPRVAVLVEALAIYLSDNEDGGDDGGNDNDHRGEVGRSSLPDACWQSIGNALEKTTQLRYLNIHVSGSPDKAVGRILDKCTFRLRRFHCDLDWDQHLVGFLNKQADLEDLYIMDFKEPGSALCAAGSSLTLDAGALPNIERLECTFSEAAMAIVPGRPITHVKTCFSRFGQEEKRAEMSMLLSKLVLSTRPLLSLDVADSSYCEAFSMELLRHVGGHVSTSMSELRHIGTLVLPVSGQGRLEFYGLLMRLPRLQCIEVEVSEWDPAPSSPAAYRALASELRLYSPDVARVIFVNDFERTVVTAVEGVCKIDLDVNFELLWRDV